VEASTWTINARTRQELVQARVAHLSRKAKIRARMPRARAKARARTLKPKARVKANRLGTRRLELSLGCATGVDDGATRHRRAGPHCKPWRSLRGGV